MLLIQELEDMHQQALKILPPEASATITRAEQELMVTDIISKVLKIGHTGFLVLKCAITGIYGQGIFSSILLIRIQGI